MNGPNEAGKPPGRPGLKLIHPTLEAARRELVTGQVIEWILRDEQRDIRAIARPGGPIAAEALVRYAVLRAITPLSTPPGRAMEIHVRLLEAGLSQIDWNAVLAALEAHDDAVYERPGPADPLHDL